MTDVDSDRRFGGLRRLYGDAGYGQIRAAHVVVIGLGGVGSWAAEALARSGVAELTLIDLDHVSESNINRQVQALSSTLGQAKAQALRERIADIHPGCVVNAIEEFADADNWPALLNLPAPLHVSLSVSPSVSVSVSESVSESVRRPVAVVIDACDQVRAKAVLAAWAIASGTPLVSVGAAGGKRQAQAVELADLADVTHDPLLAALRQRLRQHHNAPRKGPLNVSCVFSREAVVQPQLQPPPLPPPPLQSAAESAASTDSTLNCHGYGSTVSVTATFGMVAAGEVLSLLARSPKEVALPNQASDEKTHI